MFGTRTRLIATAAVVLLCAATAFSDSIVYVADFTETWADKDGAFVNGTLYYYYDTENLTASKMRFNYKLPNKDNPSDPFFVGNLYDYERGIMFSMCSKCTGSPLTDAPDPWFYDEAYYKQMEKEGTKGYWYERKDYMPAGFEQHTTQVSRILLQDKNRKDTSNIHKIIFADGRIVDFVTPLSSEGINEGSPVFYLEETCKSAGCNMKANVVFVLDNSFSISKEEWEAQKTFVLGMAADFSEGVNTALVQYSGPTPPIHCNPWDWDCQNKALYLQDSCNAGHDHVCPAGCDGKCPTTGICNETLCCNDENRKDGFHHSCDRCTVDLNLDYSYNSIPDAKTATILGIPSSDINLQKEYIKDPKNKAFKPTVTISQLDRDPEQTPGSTCQYFGLELAHRLLNNSNSGSGVKRVVIAVTDGADKCPFKTEEAAKALKANGILLIEISVKLGERCNGHDKRFLQGLASNMAGKNTPYYFSAESYDELKNNFKEMLWKDFCQELGENCDPKCKGFCGCGRCFCPECTKSGSTCFSNDCELFNEHQSDGCVVTERSCGTQKKCSGFVCHGEKEDNEGRCEAVTEQSDYCVEIKRKAQETGTCHVVECHESAPNGCYVDYDVGDNDCQKKFGTRGCEIYKCVRLEDANTQSYDAVTGCYLAKNKTKECEDILKETGEATCYRAVCTWSDEEEDGVCGQTDTCTGDHLNCYNYACTMTGHKTYSCVQSAKDRPPDNACTRYYCNDTTGWENETVQDSASCKDHFRQLGQDVRCKDFSCDNVTGCKAEDHAGCVPVCQDDDDEACFASGLAKSNNSYCVYTSCKLSPSEEPYCEDSIVDCFKDDVLAAEIERLNTQDPDNTELCYTPHCEGGVCKKFGQSKAGQVINRCQTVECKKQTDGSWTWVPVQTEEAGNCVSDECYECVCDPNFGCLRTDNCTVRGVNTDCERYECKNRKCVPVSLLLNSTCIEEVCVEKDGRRVKEKIDKDLSVVCPTSDLCKVPTCDFDPDTGDSQCVFVEKEAPLLCKNKCYNCSCDPTTGEYSTPYKCSDGDGCTVDECDIDGICSYDTLVDCDVILDMSAFPCFKAECRSDASDERGFKCMRTLLPNSYIDVCGECIIESDALDEEESLRAVQSQQSGAGLTDCTGAPAKPLLTEGLAAASIALIILAAVVIGAGIAASSVIGTKTLIDRAKGANNQSAHSNPLFEETETEMTNPAFVGE